MAQRGSSMETPLYEPLDTAKAEIRLIEILPEGFSLTTFSLENAPKYAALSYVWGGPEDKETIVLQGRIIHVRRNLALFLARIRRGQPGNQDHSLHHSLHRLYRLVKLLIYTILLQIGIIRARTNDPSHPLRTRLHRYSLLANWLVSAAMRFLFCRLRHSGDQDKEPDEKINYFWADAMCIDQQSIEERSQQVQLMGRIFGSAEAVYSWVGPSDYSLAFESIRKIAHLSQPRVASNPGGDYELKTKSLWWHPSLWRETDKSDKFGFRNKAWDSINDLVTEQYWERVWIFQEVVLARQMHLVSSGDSTLNWDELWIAASSVGGLSDRLKLGQEKKPFYFSDKIWLFLKMFPDWSKMVLIKSGKGVRDIIEIGRSLAPEIGAIREGLWHDIEKIKWDISLSSMKFTATDPRDQIYGGLAITRLPIVPDYTKTVSDVYMEYAALWTKRHCLFRRHSSPGRSPLAFLSLAGIHNFVPVHDIPSWAPDLTIRRRGKRYTWGTFGDDYDEGFRRDLNDPYVVQDTQSLFAWGFKLELISTVISGTVDSGEPFDNIVRFGLFASSFVSRYPRYVSGTPSFQAIGRLLSRQDDTAITREAVVYLSYLSRVMTSPYISDRIQRLSDPTLPETDNTRLFQNWGPKMFEASFPGTSLEQLGLDYDAVFKTPAGASLIPEDHQVLAMLLNLEKSTCFETSSGYIGMGTAQVAEGDCLCVFQGGGSPLVVRKTTDGHYQFRGTVFVLDLDPGRFIEANGTQSQWFELR